MYKYNLTLDDWNQNNNNIYKKVDMHVNNHADRASKCVAITIRELCEMYDSDDTQVFSGSEHFVCLHFLRFLNLIFFDTFSFPSQHDKIKIAYIVLRAKTSHLIYFQLILHHRDEYPNLPTVRVHFNCDLRHE